MSKSPSLRRIQADIRELSLDPSPSYHAAPLENDMFEWHFTIRGADGTDFEGGVYHGRILLPPEYPYKPPHIMFLTPTGRFETNTKICLSFTAFHPELWQPAWGIRLVLEALISFLPTPADGAIGSLDWTSSERKRLAKESVRFVCPKCCASGQTIVDLLPKVDAATTAAEASKKDGLGGKSSSPGFAKQIAELQRLQQLHEAGNNNNNNNNNKNSNNNGGGSSSNDDGNGSGSCDKKHEEQEEEDAAAKVGEAKCKASSDPNSQEMIGADKTEKNDDDNAYSASMGDDSGDFHHHAGNKEKVKGSTVDGCQPSQGPTVVVPETTAAASAATPVRTVEAAAPVDNTGDDGHVANNNNNNIDGNGDGDDDDDDDNSLSWMYDPLLNIMMLLLTMICYLLVHKCLELRQELDDLQSLNQHFYDSAAEEFGSGATRSSGHDDNNGVGEDSIVTGL